MTSYGIIAFASTHDAMCAQKALSTKHSIAVMPTPRTITASCGIAIRFSLQEQSAIVAELKALLPPETYKIYAAPF